VDHSDHIRLEGGLVRERIAYFDPLPLIATLASRPRAWPAWLCTQLARVR
jgi:hypothetical protein